LATLRYAGKGRVRRKCKVVFAPAKMRVDPGRNGATAAGRREKTNPAGGTEVPPGGRT
jgi:hypothetical protein